MMAWLMTWLMALSGGRVGDARCVIIGFIVGFIVPVEMLVDTRWAE